MQRLKVAQALSLRSIGLDQTELGQRGHTIIQADFLHDLAVDHLQDRGAGEMHLLARAKLRSCESSAGQSRFDSRDIHCFMCQYVDAVQPKSGERADLGRMAVACRAIPTLGSATWGVPC